MIRSTILLIAAAALSSASAVSIADGHSAKDFYVFGSVGQSNFDTGLSSSGGFTIDEKDTAFNIGAGYRLDKHFSLEAGWVDLGAASISTSGSSAEADLTVDGYFLGLKGEAEFSKNMSLFAKAGWVKWEAEGTISVNGLSSSDSDRGGDGFITFGAAYAITDAVSIDFQASRYMLAFTGDDIDVDTLSIGLLYSF